jgi:hypothetical protein
LNGVGAAVAGLNGVGADEAKGAAEVLAKGALLAVNNPGLPTAGAPGMVATGGGGADSATAPGGMFLFPNWDASASSPTVVLNPSLLM